MKPIYEPKGKAKEYGDYAINIYTGCPHRCYYCFAPGVLRRQREQFHDCAAPRDGIVEAVRRQLDKDQITGKTIHLCFTCDPYPMGCDTSATREVIQAIKETGNHVQILTKNGAAAMRDFDLLDEGDLFGVTYAGYAGDVSDPDYVPAEEPGSGSPYYRLAALGRAHSLGITTWVSVEPVINAQDALTFMDLATYVDLWKIGKMNYHPSDINWKAFGQLAVRILRAKGDAFYIKESLREEMEKKD